MKEKYSVINDKKLVADYKNKIAYIQGQQDFSLGAIEREYLSELLGDSYYQIENAGHNLFFDQEQAFLNAVFRIVGV